MDHNLTLITTIAAGFGGALVLGFIAEKLRLPALVGYLLAGILIGPATPGFVADVHIASQLSEIGVMLLMFGVGLHFSLGDLLSVRRLAVPGAVVQMSVATLLGMGLAWWMGWGVGSGLIFGLSLSCASTVVLLKALEARGVLDSMNGRIAVGWLVVEDLACVLVLVLMPPLAGLIGGGAAPAEESRPLWQALGQTLLQVAAFIALMLLVGRRVLPWLLWQVVKTGSRELFTLSVIAAAIGIAYGASALFSVSFALGAFFAGTVMRESALSHRAAQESLPLRDAFSVLFFVSVGMLFDPAVLMESPLKVLVVVAIMLGFPTAFTLMGMGMIFTWLAYDRDITRSLDLMVQAAYKSMVNDVLIAIPLFVFMGYLVERANLIEKLFKSLHLAMARIPGSLAVATLVTCAIFATATGIVGAVQSLLGLDLSAALTAHHPDTYIAWMQAGAADQPASA